MKICIVSQYFPPRIIGGGEISAYLIARALAIRGHKVHVLTSHPRLSTPSTKNSKVSVHELKDMISIHRILGVKTLKIASIDLTGFCVHELFFLHSFFAILSFVKNNKPDLIHALNIDSIPPSVAVAKILKIPIIVTVNSNAITCPKGDKLDVKGSNCEKKCSFSTAQRCFFEKFRYRGWRGLLFLETFLWWYIIRFFIRYADKIIAVSKHIKATLIQYGFSPKKIKVIPEMVDETFSREKIDVRTARNELGIPPTDKVILYAGAIFDFRKGSRVLLEAMRKVIKTIPTAKLIIMGIVPSIEMKIIETIGLKKHVIITGFLPRNKVASIYAAADLVVFPSVWPEPYGLVLIEAMSKKKPVVASRIGGILDVIDSGKNGILVTPGDAKELANAIIQVLTDEKLARRLGKAGKETVKRKFSEHVIIRRITDVYHNCLNHKNRVENV